MSLSFWISDRRFSTSDDCQDSATLIGNVTFCTTFKLCGANHTRLNLFMELVSFHWLFPAKVFLDLWPQFDKGSPFGRKKNNLQIFRIINRVPGFTVVGRRFKQSEKWVKFDNGWALNSDRRQVSVTNLTTGWVRWWLEETKCCCWERFLKNGFSE